MKLKKGDKVRNSDHGMQGEVVRVRDDGTYDIRCSDGLERPGNDQSHHLDPFPVIKITDPLLKEMNNGK